MNESKIDIQGLVREIAGELSAGQYVDQYLNLETGEIEVLPCPYGFCDDWDEEIVNEAEDKIYSWDNMIKFEALPSYETFQIMEDFVLYELPAGSQLQQRLEEALRRKHPFSNFNAIIHNCSARQAWFDYRQKAFERRVVKILLAHECLPAQFRDYCENYK
ncbi:MAG: hypothetical protein LIP03_14355 [Bacteroidales bacterium]|nr:hypothetical protein [Bacteroidales bacterium]